MVMSLTGVGVSAAPSLSSSSITLTKGYQTTLKLSGNRGTAEWSSDDKGVATVSQSGVVVGKAKGTTNIYAVVDGYTLKTKVQVVETKITLNKMAVSLEVDDIFQVTVTILGDKSGLSISNSDSRVAKGAWDRPVVWDGNKVTFTISANKAGTANIKVYRKGYSQEYFKTITVTVTDPEMTSSTTNTITPIDTALTLNVKEAVPLRVFADTPKNVEAISADPSVAKVSLYSTNGSYVTFRVDGVKKGATSIKIYDINNAEKYISVPVNVKDTASFYTVVTEVPSKANDTDQIIQFVYNGKTYYQLVPKNYDTALAETEVAKLKGKYEYYTIYSVSPTKNAADDTIEYILGIKDNQYVSRFILLPKDIDKVKYATATAFYNNVFEYYTVYNKKPTSRAANDTYATWSVIDPDTRKSITRYVLLPVNYDATRLASLKDNDLESNSSYNYYEVMTTLPNVDSAKDTVFSWYDAASKKTKFMVVPKTNLDFVKRNDVIAKDTGKYNYFNAYSTSPTVQNAQKEAVYTWTMQSGNTFVTAYILVDKTDPDWYNKLLSASSGANYYGTPQGTFASNTVYDQNGRA
jgi:hypothetical protein